jgi:hypothetical protein
MSDSFNTAVPQPSFTTSGFVAPTEDAILDGVQEDLNTALGGNINPSLTNPTGQIATTETAVIGDNYAQFVLLTNQFDPALNSGRYQDAIGRIYFMTRIPGQSTVQGVSVAGLNNVPIQSGSITAQDQDDNLWIVGQSGTITNGSVTLNFSCAVNGPTAGPSSLSIVQAPSGVESLTITGDPVLGRNTETASEYEQRRQQSVAANSINTNDSIQGTVLAVTNVLDAFVVDNPLKTPQTINGVIVGPNSIYVCALGGSSQAICNAIWTKKPPGCGYNGNTTETVTDPNPAYNPPAPEYSVSYEVPSIVPFVMLVVLRNNSGIPSNAPSLVQTAIINAFAGLDGGSRAKIGSTVFASRYYGDIATLGNWALIISVQIGVLGSGATFTASCSGTTLTVSAVAAGTLSAGQLLQDSGVLATGTTIVSQLSGTFGGTGTYQVSIAQTVTSETMTATNLVNDVTMTMAQAPSIVALNINTITQ